MNNYDKLDWRSCQISNPDVPKLENLASSCFAVRFWRNEIMNESLAECLIRSDQKVKKFIAENVSSIPPRILNLISKGIRLIGEELWIWLCSNDDCTINRHRLMKTFRLEECDTWAKYFDDLVWNADYSINCLKTCVNLLQSNRVSDSKKFFLACSYCLQDHIEDLWERVLNAVYYEVNSRDPAYSWLLHYWINRMQNQTLSCLQFTTNFIVENDLMRSGPFNRFATEYFWPYLSSERQVSHVLRVIRHTRYRIWKHQYTGDLNLKYLLLKLNDFQLRTVVAEEGPTTILKLLIQIENCQPLAMPFWNHFKNKFQEHEFFDLVEWMYKCEAEGRNGYVLQADEISFYQQIWDSALNQLKEFVSSEPQVHRLISIMKFEELPEHCDVKVLRMVLSEASSELKSSIWRKHWLAFFDRAKLSILTELLKLCLEDANQRDEFDREFAARLLNSGRVRAHCFMLLYEMKLDRLDEFLKAFSIDHNAKMALKQRLVWSYFLNHISNVSHWFHERPNKFMAFIDDTFPDLHMREGFKKEFQRVCHRCLDSGTFRKFDASQWQDLIMWCLGSEEKVAEFKRSIDARKVAYALIGRYQRCNVEVLFDLHVMNNSFLRWKFASEDDVVTFKQSLMDANSDDGNLHLLMFGMFKIGPCKCCSEKAYVSRGSKKLQLTESRKSKVCLRKSRKSKLFQCRLKRKHVNVRNTYMITYYV